MMMTYKMGNIQRIAKAALEKYAAARPSYGLTVDNNQENFQTVDGNDDYSVVAETENNQTVLYIYDRKNNKINGALMLPSIGNKPYNIKVEQAGNKWSIALPGNRIATFDTKTNKGNVSKGFSNWILT
jgi:streptogramin lyase